MASFVPYILSIFSNPPDSSPDHLKYLEEEKNILKALIKEANKQEEFNIQHYVLEDRLDNDLSIQTIAEDIYDLKKKYTVIHYSGHADRAMLSLQKEALRSENFIRFISECEKLKIVVLNACSTEGFVKKMLENTNVRAVIATDKPVGDEKAKRFSKEFYKRLTTNEYLTDSFLNALSSTLLVDYKDDSFIVKAVFNGDVIAEGTILSDRKDATNTRGIKKKLDKLFEKDEEEAKWGLYCRFEDILDWKVFNTAHAYGYVVFCIPVSNFSNGKLYLFDNQFSSGYII